MQTSWPGVALPAGNMVLEEVYIAKTAVLVLPDTPGVFLQAQLPPTTMGIKLYTSDDDIWFALDTPPGPIPLPLQANVILPTEFVLGDVVRPNQSEAAALPDDGLQHTLYLVSQGSSPKLYITVLTETP